MAFSYLLEYAGVPFCLDEGKVFRMGMKPPSTEVEESLGPRKFQPLPDLIDELNRLLPFLYLDDFGVSPSDPTLNLSAIADNSTKNRFPNPEVKIGDYKKSLKEYYAKRIEDAKKQNAQDAKEGETPAPPPE